MFAYYSQQQQQRNSSEDNGNRQHEISSYVDKMMSDNDPLSSVRREIEREGVKKQQAIDSFNTKLKKSMSDTGKHASGGSAFVKKLEKFVTFGEMFVREHEKSKKLGIVNKMIDVGELLSKMVGQGQFDNSGGFREGMMMDENEEDEQNKKMLEAGGNASVSNEQTELDKLIADCIKLDTIQTNNLLFQIIPNTSDRYQASQFWDRFVISLIETNSGTLSMSQINMLKYSIVEFRYLMRTLKNIGTMERTVRTINLAQMIFSISKWPNLGLRDQLICYGVAHAVC